MITVRYPDIAFHTTYGVGYASTRILFKKQLVAVTHSATSTTNTHNCGLNIKLLRKEVIQPHLPVRLPCYDFVPIADPTFDSSF